MFEILTGVSDMKISFVNQPWTIAAPPKGSDSTGIWSYQVSTHLPKDWNVTYYGCEGTIDRTIHTYSSDSFSQIEYKAISNKLDRVIKIPGKIAHKLESNSGLPYFGSRWFNLGYGWQIADSAARQNYDVIHIHNFSQFVPLIRAKNPEAKIVLHLHCEWVNRLPREPIAARLADADLIISCSDYITNKIKERFPNYANICGTVNNGVDANYFAPAFSKRSPSVRDAPQLLFVGRISPEKGIHDLIDAFVKVVAKHPKAVLTIAGPHIIVSKELLFDLQPEPEVRALEYFYSVDYLEHIKSKIPKAISSQVIFTGSLPQQELLPYYQNADLVINPSLSEAFGMSLVEAMATATPVIATDIGGMPEIVEHNRTGLVVQPGNPQALANAISQVISNPVQARTMGRAGRKKVLQHYTWSKITEKLVDCYATMGAEVNKYDNQKAVARSLS